jgi:hypothetical protein
VYLLEAWHFSTQQKRNRTHTPGRRRLKYIHTHQSCITPRAALMRENERIAAGHAAAAANNAPNRFQCAFSNARRLCNVHHMHLEQALKIKLHTAPREREYMLGGLGVFLLQGAAHSRAFMCDTRTSICIISRSDEFLSCTLLDLNE